MKIAGIPILSLAEANKLVAEDERAFSFTTRDDEVGVVYLDEKGKIIGLWFDFNPLVLFLEQKHSVDLTEAEITTIFLWAQAAKEDGDPVAFKIIEKLVPVISAAVMSR